MYQIQLNQSGTHTLEITDKHLETIQEYTLFQDLIDSNGYIDESVLDKLKCNIRSFIDTQSDCNCGKDLLKLCDEVIFHPKMKAFGLHKLIILFIDWQHNKQAE